MLVYLDKRDAEEARRHIHVAQTDGEAKYWLEPTIELAKNQRMSQNQIGEAPALIEQLQEEILHAWNDHFGS